MSTLYPEISVCVITFNQEQFIAEAVNSILAQEISVPFEIVIGEDSSADDTRSICRELADIYPSVINLLPTERRLGIMANFLRTLSNCRGRYIAVCEGDDYWIDSGKLATQYNCLEKNVEYGLIYSDVEIRNTTPGELSRPHYFSGEVFGKLLEGNFINTPTVFFRKDLIKLSEINNDQIRYAYDHFFWLRIAASAQIFFMPVKSSCYRIHGSNFSLTGRISSKNERLKLYPEFILDAIHFYLNQNNERQLIRTGKKVLMRKWASSLLHSGVTMKELKYLWLMLKIICRPSHK